MGKDSTGLKEEKRKSSFNKNSFKFKIIFGYVIVLFTFLILVFITSVYTSALKSTEKLISTIYTPSIVQTYELINKANHSIASLKENIYSSSKRGNQTINAQRKEIAEKINILKPLNHNIGSDEATALFVMLENSQLKLESALNEGINLVYSKPELTSLLTNVPDSVQLLLADLNLGTANIPYHHSALEKHYTAAVAPALESLSIASSNYIEYLNEKVEGLKKETEAYFNSLFIISIGLCIVVIAFIVLLIIHLHSSILKSIGLVKEKVQVLSEGEFPEELATINNEFNEILLPLYSLVNNLKNIQLFTQHVGNKDFDNEIKVFNDKGALGTSLADMRNSLKNIAEEDRIRYWTNEGLAKFSEILRNNTDNLSEISESIVRNLTKYLDANQGGLFIVNDDKADDLFLELTACFAFERKKYIDKKLFPGEGLVGQCYLEQQYIYLKEIPENYLNITSGLGSARPSNILIVPLKINDIVYGVVELASFKEFSQYQIDFVLRISESVANAISDVKSNEKNLKLLKGSQEMMEQLRSQEEEMRQNMEELQATQEEVERKSRELEETERNLKALLNNTTECIMSIDAAYKPLFVNEAYKKRYHAAGIKIENCESMLDAIDAAIRDEWKGYYDRALSGEQFRITFESGIGEDLMEREYFFNPLSDYKGEISGLSIFAREVFNKKKQKKAK